jgi:hypothetical protein
MTRGLMVAAFVVLGVIVSAQAPRFADPDRRAKLERAFPEIDRIVEDFTSVNHVPGAAWGVVIDGELAHAGVTGIATCPRSRRSRKTPRSASRR